MPRSRSISWLQFLITNALWLALVLGILFLKSSKTEKIKTSQREVTFTNEAQPSLLQKGDAAKRLGTANGETADEAGEIGKGQLLGERVSLALSLDDPIERMARFSNLIRDLNPENLPETLKAIEEAERKPGDDAMLTNFMRAWVRMDPKTAMDYALDEEGNRKFYVSNSDDELIKEWATRDANAAIAYLDEIPLDHKQNRKSLHHHVVEALVKTDLARATQLAEENQFGRERGQSIELLAKTYARERGPEGVKAWLDGIDSEQGNRRSEYKKYALGQAARYLMSENPNEARALVEDHAANGLVDSRALGYAARGIAKQSDYSEAATWLTEFPESGSQKYALASTVSRWADDEPNAAGEWLRTQDLNPSMDVVVSRFSQEIAGDDPEAALAWGSIITNEKQQRDSMIRAMRSWAKRDQGGLQNWLQQNEVPPSVAQYVRRYDWGKNL